MPILSRLTLLIKISLLFCALFVLNDTAYAVTMDVMPGFNSVVARFGWAPVAVKLTNPDTVQIEGELHANFDAIMSGYMGYSFSYCSRKVILPPNSVKLYHMYIIADYMPNELKIQLKDGNRLIVENKTSCYSLRQFFVVSIGSKTSRLFYLEGEDIKNSSKPSFTGSKYKETITSSSIEADILPDRAIGYNGVEALIAHNLPVSSLSPQALDSIGIWVASGGVLVVSGGPDYKSLQNEFYKELLPVTVTGTTTISNSKILSEMGKSKFSYNNMVVANSIVKSGIDANAKIENGVPLVVSRRYGGGKVIYLAFDHLSSPFKDWQGKTEFWLNLLKSNTPEGVIKRKSVDRYSAPINVLTLAEAVESLPESRMIPITIIIGFLAVYVLMLIPVNYWYMKKKRILEKAWLSTLAIIAFFTLFAYGIGFIMRGDQLIMQQGTLLQFFEGEKYAYKITDASIFSPALKTYKVQLNDPNAIIDNSYNSDITESVDVFLDDITQVENIKMAMWTNRTLNVTSGEKLAGTIESDLELVGNQIIGTITNNTGIDFTDCIISNSFRVAAIPNLPNNKTIKVKSNFSTDINAVLRNYNKTNKSFDDKLDRYIVSEFKNSSSSILFASYKSNENYMTINSKNGKFKSLSRAVIKLNVKSNSAGYSHLSNVIKGKQIGHTGSTITVFPAVPYAGLPSPEMRSNLELYINGSTDDFKFRIPKEHIDKLISLVINASIKHDSSITAKEEFLPEFSIFNNKTSAWIKLDQLNIMPPETLVYVNTADVNDLKTFVDKNNEFRIRVETPKLPNERYLIYLNLSVSGIKRN